jgi:uncharacterized protein YbaA (DUF1428 family)
MTYVDGFVVAVPIANKEAYRKHASGGAPLFKENGVSRVVENWADDVPDGKVTDFKRSVKAQEGETIVFAWMEFPDRQAREAAVQKMRADSRMTEMSKDLPFDRQRMIYGGFEVVSDIGKGGKCGYVDATVIPIPAARRAEYIAWATKMDELFVKAGASRVVDCIGDDVPPGKVTDYFRAVQATGDEKIGFGWIEWPSKQVRDEAWKSMMDNEEMKNLGMPFDGKRMIFGGFVPIVGV